MGSPQLTLLGATLLVSPRVLWSRSGALDLNGAWVGSADNCASGAV